MVKVQKISGYDDFKAKIDDFATSAIELVVLFTGAKDSAGKSWCPDCNDGNSIPFFDFFHTIN